jgi:CHAT domain-containing protein/Tfp pilus assembly protein PilF
LRLDSAAARAEAGVIPRCLAVLLVLTFLEVPAPAQPSVEATLKEASALQVRNEYLKALELARTVPESAPPRLVARKHRILALSLTDLGRFSEVPAHLERIQRLADASGDVGELVRAATVAGHLQKSMRSGDRGLAAFERAVALAAKTGDRRLLGNAYADLSGVYLSAEDWERGVYYNEKGFDLLDAPTPNQRFDHAMQLGIGYFELYDRDAAEAQLKTGLALARESGAKRGESWALGELAYTYWTFDRDASRALALYQQALDLAVEAKVTALEGNWRLNRGNVWRDTGDYPRALDDYRRAVQIGTASGSKRLHFPAIKNIGQTQLLMGQPNEARHVLETLIKERPGSPTLRHRWQAHMELASTYQALGLADPAEVQYREMLTLLEDQRNTAILDTFRTGTFAHSLSAYDPYDRYIRFLLGRNDRPEAASEALEVAEQARARSFLELLKPVRASVASRLPPAVLDEEARILRGISGIQEQLRAADRPRADRERLLAELAAFERDRERFRLTLRVEHPALAEARYPALAEIPELQRILRPDEVVVSFTLSEPESFRWVVGRDRVDVSRIAGRKTIEASAGRLRQLVRAPSDLAAVRTEAAALATLLLTDFAPVRDAPLVIVPHGALNYVPFEILPHDGGLLIERHAVTYAPSINALAQFRRPRGTEAPFRVLAVGNPAVGRAGGPPVKERGADVDSLALLGPLPFARDELRVIRRIFPSATDTLSGPEATEAALRRGSLGNYSIVHFATHGLVHDTRPSRSGLLMSPGAGDDGLLQSAEIYGLGLRSDLVVLSACQTALGREVTGEGIVGLTRAFFFAGSRAVMAALWNLNDRFAADFVGRFYGQVRAGQSLEEALRWTKVSYVNDPKFAHPFYWSSLVLAGDGTRAFPRIPQNPAGSDRILWLAAGSLLALLSRAALLWNRRVSRVRSGQ